MRIIYCLLFTLLISTFGLSQKLSDKHRENPFGKGVTVTELETLRAKSNKLYFKVVKTSEGKSYLMLKKQKIIYTAAQGHINKETKVNY
jgi:hypothetical protein